MAIGSKLTRPWREEKLGLTMIIASLLVIVFIVVSLFQHQRDTQKNQIRNQGVSITRILSKMPIDYMMESGNIERVMEIIRLSQRQSDFAYAVAVNETGNIIAQEAAADVIIPLVESATQHGERYLTLGEGGQDIIEYFAPLSATKNGLTSIHLAYFAPGLGLSMEQIPFIATLCLPIFLLTPLFYFMVRKEIKPLAQVNKEIENYLTSGHLNRIELNASGELSDFMHKLDRLFDHTTGKINTLESQLKQHSTSGKLLSYQRGRIESVLQAIPDGLLVLDQAGKITYANSKAAAVLGSNADTIKSKDPKAWCNNQEVIIFLSNCMGSSGAAYTASSVTYTPKHDDDKKIRLTAYPLFSRKEDNGTNGTLVSLRDVTHEHLERQSRSDFIGHVSHELKSPLSVMRLYIESLQGEDGENEEFRVTAFNIISDEVERMTMLINNLLSITQMEMGAMNIDRKRTRLHDLLKDSLRSVSRSGKEKHIQFKLDVPENLSAVSIDKDLMRVAVNNLLTNAIKYNRDNGEVVLSATEDDDVVRISVSDTGIGIAPQDQDRVFEKFFRSDSEESQKRSGQGLGLALAGDIIQLHNGRLMLNSKVDKGSEFIIEITKSNIKLEEAS